MTPVDDLRKTYPDATERNVIPPMGEAETRGEAETLVLSPSLVPASLDLAVPEAVAALEPEFRAHVPLWLKVAVASLGAALVLTAILQLPRAHGGPAAARIPAMLQVTIEALSSPHDDLPRPSHGP